jgi:hypothetical protein
MQFNLIGALITSGDKLAILLCRVFANIIQSSTLSKFKFDGTIWNKFDNVVTGGCKRDNSVLEANSNSDNTRVPSQAQNNSNLLDHLGSLNQKLLFDENIPYKNRK